MRACRAREMNAEILYVFCPFLDDARGKNGWSVNARIWPRRYLRLDPVVSVDRE